MWDVASIPKRSGTRPRDVNLLAKLIEGIAEGNAPARITSNSIRPTVNGRTSRCVMRRFMQLINGPPAQRLTALRALQFLPDSPDIPRGTRRGRAVEDHVWELEQLAPLL